MAATTNADAAAGTAPANGSNTTTINISLGQHRLHKDRRQYGALLLVLSLAALVYPLRNLAYRVGRDGTSADKGIPLISLISSVFIGLIGMTGMVVGYLSTVHEYSNKYLSMLLIAVVQLSWLPYIADMAKTARDADELIHPFYQSEEQDDNIVAAMGVLGIFGYLMHFLGSIGFFAFGLYGFHSGNYKFHTKAHYRSRLAFYSFFTFVAGFSQLFLGSYIRAEFPLDDGALLIPIATGPYFIMIPAIAIFIGCVQIANSILCAARAFGWKNGRDDHLVQWAFLIQWILMMVLQVAVQFSFPEGELGSSSTPAVAALIVAFNVMPAFLDYKLRTTPATVLGGYYSDEAIALTIEEDNNNHVKGRESDSMSDEELGA